MGEKVCPRRRPKAGDYITGRRDPDYRNVQQHIPLRSADNSGDRAQHDETQNIHLFPSGHQRTHNGKDCHGHMIRYNEDILHRCARLQTYE